MAERFPREIDRASRNTAQAGSHRRRDVSPSLSQLSSTVSGLEWDHSADVHVNQIDDQIFDDLIQDNRFAFSEHMQGTSSFIHHMMRSRSLEFDRQVDHIVTEPQRPHGSMSNLRSEALIRRVAEFLYANVPPNNMPRGGSMHAYSHVETPQPIIVNRETTRPVGTYGSQSMSVQTYSVSTGGSLLSSSSQAAGRQSSYTHITTPRPSIVEGSTPRPVMPVDNYGAQSMSVHTYSLPAGSYQVSSFPEAAGRQSSYTHVTTPRPSIVEGSTPRPVMPVDNYGAQSMSVHTYSLPAGSHQVSSFSEAAERQSSYTHITTPRPSIVEGSTPRPVMPVDNYGAQSMSVHTYSLPAGSYQVSSFPEAAGRQSSYTHITTPRPSIVEGSTPRPVSPVDNYGTQSMSVRTYSIPTGGSQVSSFSEAAERQSSYTHITTPRPTVVKGATPRPVSPIDTYGAQSMSVHTYSLPAGSSQVSLGSNNSPQDSSLSEWLESGKTKSEIEYESRKQKAREVIESEGSSLIMIRLQADTAMRENRSIEKYLKSRGVQTDLSGIPPKMVDRGTNARASRKDYGRQREHLGRRKPEGGRKNSKDFPPKSDGGHKYSKDFQPKADGGHKHSKDFQPKSDGGHKHSKDFQPKSDGGYKYWKDFQPESDGGHKHSKDFQPKSDGGYKYWKDFQPESDGGHKYWKDFPPKSDGGHKYSKDFPPKSDGGHKNSKDFPSKSDGGHKRSKDFPPKSDGGHKYSKDVHPKSDGGHKYSKDVLPKSDGGHKRLKDFPPKSDGSHKYSKDVSPKSSQLRSSVAFFIPAKTETDSENMSSELSIYRRKRGVHVKPRQPSIVEEDKENDTLSTNSWSWSDIGGGVSTSSEGISGEYRTRQKIRSPSKPKRIPHTDPRDVTEKYYSDDSLFVQELNAMSLTKALVTKKPSFISKSKQRQEKIRNRRKLNIEHASVKRAQVEKLLDENKRKKAETVLYANYAPEVPEPEPEPFPYVPRRKARDYKKSMTKEVKEQTQKIYVNLPEVLQKKRDEEKTKDREVNRTMKGIFSARLREKARRGELNISMSKSVVSASNLGAYVKKPSNRYKHG